MTKWLRIGQPRRWSVLLVVIAVMGGCFVVSQGWAIGWPRLTVGPAPDDTALGSAGQRHCQATASQPDRVRGSLPSSRDLLRFVQHCTNATLGTPQTLTATAPSTSQVTLNWQAGSGATTPHHYEIWRSRAQDIVLLATVTQPTTTYTDSSLPAGTAYVYRVRAVDANGAVSVFSNADVATTVVFQEPIQQFVTTVKAQHLTELRPAIDAVRTCAGMPVATWGPAPQIGGIIVAADVTALRTQLTPALSALGLPATWTDDPLVAGSTLIKKVHVQELRNAVN